MSSELLTAFVVFVVVMSVTPGPNNMMVLASGVNFGFQRTLPHMLGIAIGSAAMVFLISAGFGQILDSHPSLQEALQITSIIYMLWLASKIARSGPVGSAGAKTIGRPIRFLQAVGFQWVNPKSWTLSLGAVSTYIDPRYAVAAGVEAAAIFALVAIPSVAIWAAFGPLLRRFLANDRRVHAFNWIMALALVASLLPTILDVMSHR